MVNNKKRIPKGLVKPAVNAGIGAVEQIVKDTLSEEKYPVNDRHAYKIDLLKKKNRYILFVPESGPMDNQLY
jgi:hypothetical protein